MQREIDAASPSTPVQILGVNGTGREAANELATDGNDIPLLQDTAGADVWTSWDITYRDVVVLDAENRLLFIYNLSTYDLSNPTNFLDLKTRILDAAD